MVFQYCLHVPSVSGSPRSQCRIRAGLFGKRSGTSLVYYSGNLEHDFCFGPKGLARGKAVLLLGKSWDLVSRK